jgi:predicted negative regulator of RcsB-dependent stress response
MANHLDLEEQEQLDQLKHFWNQYGNLITWALIVVLGALAAWNGYQWWQRSQATQAAAMYDEVERVVRSGDVTKAERAFTDMKERFASTAYAQQAGLLVGKMAFDAGKADTSKMVLTWVAEKSIDPGYQAVARLRLSSLLMDAKSMDEALAMVSGDFPAEFAPLVADRKGDILSAQSKRSDAIAQYQKAYRGLDERTDYRRLVEVKLNALGVSPDKQEATP